MKKSFILTAIMAIACMLPLWGQQRYNFDVENAGTSCSVTLPGTFNSANAYLPDPFTKLNGQRMTTKAEWTCRRQEILKLLERTVYGTKPAKPASVTGTVSRSLITVNVGGESFSVTVTMPSGGTAPYPLVIRYDNSGVPASNFTSNGVAVANLTTSTVGGGNRTNKTGVFYRVTGSSRTGHLAAWAWGVSRIIDVIEADPNRLFDPTKIGVTGCSRDGKGAFAAGVLDQRIALTMPMESGTGGMAAMRVSYANRDQSGGTNGSQSPSSAYGEQPWLGDDFNPFGNNPNTLPIDMHEAIAAVAPRGFLAVYKTASSAGQWLGVPGSHVSAVAGAEVYKALGFGGNFAWLNTGTSSHCQWVDAYNATVKDFIDIFLHRTKTPGTTPIFTENNRPNMSQWVNWTTPTLSGTFPITPLSGYALTTAASPATGGNITTTPAPDANGRFAEGSTVSVTAVPATGWRFVSWSGAATGTTATISVQMNADKTLTAQFAPTVDGTTNLIKNGTFAGTTNWTLNQWANSAGTFSANGNEGTITITTLPSGSGAADHSLQLVQNGIALNQGMHYRLTFDAVANSARTMSVYMQMDADPYTSYLEKTVNLSTTKQSYSYEFSMTENSDPNGRIAFNVGNANPTIRISNVKLIYIAEPSPEPEPTFTDPCTQNTRLTNPEQVYTSNSSGNRTLPGSPLGYEMWTDGGQTGNNRLSWYGNNRGGGGAFKAEWNNPNDYLGRVGYYWGNGQQYTAYKNIYVDYNYTNGKSGTGGGYSYIGIYGWSRNPSASQPERQLVEYYIIDDWFGNGQLGTATTGGTKVGEYVLDGGTYHVITNIRVNKPSIDGDKTFIQYFSIRQGMGTNTRHCGTYSVTEHFKQWERLGLMLGSMYECKFLVEAGGGAGSVDLSYLKFSQEDDARGTTPPGNFTLTTNASPTIGGTVSKLPNAASYAPGTQVQLTAVAANGWEFAGWTGDATGSATTISVTMNSNKTVTAIFTPVSSDENFIRNGTFAGTTNWSIQNGNGSSATLSANNNTATINISATGANSWEPQMLQRQVVLRQGLRYVLSFEASAAAARSMDVLLQMSASPYTTYTGTSVDLTTGMQLFEYEFEMTHATDENAQLAFNVGQSTQNVSIRNVQLRYSTEPVDYFTLTTNVSPANSGTVSKSPDAANYASGRQVGLTATPAAGWEFAGWTGDATGNTATTTVTVDTNKTVTAMFIPANIIQNGTFAGTANWSIQNGNGSSATLSANNNTATINISAAGANSWEPQLLQKQISLTQDTRYVLSFEASAASARTMDVLLQMSASPYTTYTGTSVNLTTGMQLFEYEFVMTHASDANAQLAFNVGQSTQNVNIRNVQLRYSTSAVEYFTLTTNVSPANSGTVSKSPDAANYALGRQVGLTATPAAGWEFAGWTGDASGSASTVSVTMDTNKTVTATFIPASIIQNGTFAGTANWAIQNGNGSSATLSANNNTATINISAAGANSWEPQLLQKQITLTQGTSYVLTFEASAAAARTMDAMLQMSSSPYTTYAGTSVNVTTGMQQFVYEFEMTHATDQNVQLAFNVGQSTQNVNIRNVQLRPTGSTSPVLPPNIYEVATWEDFKTAAVTFTFDDASPNQFTAAVPLFNNYGYKASFYPTPAMNMNTQAWNTLRNLVNNGHEVGNHSVTHPNAPMSTTEMTGANTTINNNVGVMPNTVAYPHCIVPNKTTAAQYFIGGRICNGQVENKTPADYFEIGSIICGNQGSCNTLANFQTRLTTAKNNQGWAVFLIHEINNGGGYSPLQSSVLGSTLDYINTNASDYWVTTFRNAILYSKERNAAVVRELSATASAIQLEVTDNLANNVYNYPLSLRCALPAGWENVTATQGANAINLRIANGYMYFKAVPDGGIISLSNGASSLRAMEMGEAEDAQEYNETIVVIENPITIYPNPVKDNLMINAGTEEIDRIEIVSIAGKIWLQLPFSNIINVSTLSPGIYMIKMYSNKGVTVQRFVKE